MTSGLNMYTENKVHLWFCNEREPKAVNGTGWCCRLQLWAPAAGSVCSVLTTEMTQRREDLKALHCCPVDEHTCNPGAQNPDAGGVILVPGQPRLHNKTLSQASKSTALCSIVSTLGGVTCNVLSKMGKKIANKYCLGLDFAKKNGEVEAKLSSQELSQATLSALQSQLPVI